MKAGKDSGASEAIGSRFCKERLWDGIWSAPMGELHQSPATGLPFVGGGGGRAG